MAYERVSFMGASGHELAARLDLPKGEIKAYGLFAHCFSCSKDLGAVNRISRALNEDGIAVFRFDFTGLGQSEGDFSDTNFTSNVGDILAAVSYMRDNLAPPTVMMGHSLGGAAILIAGNDVPEVRAVATIGAPANAVNVLKQFGDDIGTIEQEGQADVMLGGRPFVIKKQFVDDARAQDILASVKTLRKPLLVMHSPIDATVDVDHARQIYEAAMHPKSFVSLDHADHLLMKDPADGIYVARLISAWASQYIRV
ncbi:MAG: osmotically inducible protein OsmC [Kordiimonadales bacterium]|nr:MAG: osmotically inducible protein OsmC [Kordiimonadales bacterium]